MPTLRVSLKKNLSLFVLGKLLFVLCSCAFIYGYIELDIYGSNSRIVDEVFRKHCCNHVRMKEEIVSQLGKHRHAEGLGDHECAFERPEFSCDASGCFDRITVAAKEVGPLYTSAIWKSEYTVRVKCLSGEFDVEISSLASEGEDGLQN